MDKQILEVQTRKTLGRKVKSLRKEGILPANVFGKKIKSLSLQVKLDDFIKVFKKVGETGLVTLAVKGGKGERPVLVANIQKDPLTDLPIHIDFHQVDLKEKVEAEVAVELIGESPIEKQGLGTVVLHVDEVKVEALPADLPEKFEIDASALTEVDQTVFAKDLKFDKKKVELKIDPKTIIVKVEPPQKEEVVTPPPAAEVPVEGAEPVEGKEGEEAKPAEEAPTEEKKEEPKDEAPKS
jgi:large subunit ribosomal protein L25